jgi:protein gp37
MSANSEIAWTRHTFNPVWGCTKVSAGCANCYAEAWAKRTGDDVWGPGERRVFGDAHWREPLKWNRLAALAGERHRVFCGSMCDIGEDHPTTAAQLPRLMELIFSTPSLDWLLLTKRPERLGPYLGAWLDDQDWRTSPSGTTKPAWWLGTSIEDQATADRRIPELLRWPASVHFVSYEPALAPVDLSPYLPCAHVEFQQTAGGWACTNCGTIGFDAPARPGVVWVIVGGESGPRARPFHVEWAREAVRQCRAFGAAPFVKQLGANVMASGMSGPGEHWPIGGSDLVDTGRGYFSKALRDRKGSDPEEWPRDLRVRELPVVGVG